MTIVFTISHGDQGVGGGGALPAPWGRQGARLAMRIWRAKKLMVARAAARRGASSSRRAGEARLY